MLELKTFISGMTTLQKCYIGWQFDVKDEMQVMLWYSSFKNLTEDKFKELIKDYYVHNRQPPTCIRDLTDILVDKVYEKAPVKPDVALDKVRSIVSRRGGWEYEGRTEIYQDLAKYPALCETVKEFESDLRSMAANDTYTADRFRKAYAVKLRASAIRHVDKELGLALPEGNQPQLANALPYEQ